MIYLYSLRSLSDVANWLAGHSATTQSRLWAGAAAASLNLTGLDPSLSLREACEPIWKIKEGWPAQPAGLAMHFPCPVAAGRCDAEVGAAYIKGFHAALGHLEAEYTFALASRDSFIVGNLLFAVAVDHSDRMITATIMGWTCTDGGRWVWLDLWRLIEWLPEVQSTFVQAMAGCLVEQGLELVWNTPQMAEVRGQTN